MFLRRSKRYFVARLALAAMLFSALSPAMASASFADRPDILARVLGVPAKPDTASHSEPCHDAAGLSKHDEAAPQQHDQSGHAAHSIYCSFCLAASSVVTLPDAANAIAMVFAPVTSYFPGGQVQPTAAYASTTRHPRDPPVALR